MFYLEGFTSVCVCVCVCASACAIMSNSCDSMVYSPPGSSVHGIFFQARIRERVAISSSTGSSLGSTLGSKANFPGLRDWQEDSLLLSCLGRVYLQLPKRQVQWKGSQKDAISWGRLKKGGVRADGR